ncbi:MAG: DUF3231 family protein, partial [Tumebacillaceae bacterium]
MTNIFEAIQSVIKTFVDNEPKSPLHVGEVMSLWTMLAIFQEAYCYYEASLNTTTDDQLKHLLQEAIEGANADIKLLKNFMIKEGVPIPPASEPKPKSDPNDIPLGVKLTDYEIANSLSAKIATSVTFTASSMAQCVRNDVSILFFRIQIHM